MKSDIRYKQKVTANYTWQRSLLVIIVALFLIMPSMTTVVKAVDIIVDDDGDADYDDINAAIAAASPGDIIWVEDGSYNEQLNVNVNNLVIKAANGAQPKLYISSYDPGIDITASDVKIEGFKIYGNGGVTVQASAGANNAKIIDNEFVTSGETGNVVFQVQSGVTGTEFKSNTVNDYNIVVNLSSNAQVSISGNTFQDVNYSIYHGVNIVGTNIYYGSIQDAVNSADPDDELMVAAGTFIENVVIDKPLTILGIQQNNKPFSSSRGIESVINGNTLSPISVQEGTTDVIINGFKLTIPNKDPGSNQAGILVGKNTDNIQLSNNIIYDITDSASADTLSNQCFGILIWGRTPTGGHNIIIRDNYIEQVEEFGMGINDNSSHITIESNIIKDLVGSDHSSDPQWLPTWPAYQCSAINLGGQIGPLHDVTINNNILFTNQTGDGVTTAAGAGISFTGLPLWTDPSQVWQGYWNISITNNVFQNNTGGLILLDGSFNNALQIHDNNLSENLFGVNNTIPTVSVDATNNWWGDITGPYNALDNSDGLGSEVDGNVTFWPWYEFDGYSIPPLVEYQLSGPSENNGEYITDETEIEITATDEDSGMYSLTYRTWDSTNRWTPWQNYTDEFTLPGEGKHIVEYNATDNAGTSTIDTEEHIIDTQSPAVEVLHPNGEENLYGTVNIEWIASDQILDQEQVNQNMSMPVTEDYPGHIQSFIPSEDEIRSVQLLIEGDHANVSVRLYSSISPVPTSIAQSSKTLQAIGNPGSPVWIDFPFSQDIELTIGETYYIGVTQKNLGESGFKWHLFNASTGPNAYEYGQAWIKETDNLIQQPNWDFSFRTMYWNTDLDITVQYSMTGVSPWSTLAEDETNDGSYSWNTETYPDAESYRIRIIAEDLISNQGADASDGTFRVDNDGPSITSVVITDTSVSSTEFCKDGDNVEINAQIQGDPISISADLSNLGGGSEVSPTSFTGNTASWTIPSIQCNPSNGLITVSVTATDSSGDTSSASGTITSDNTLPECGITRPGPGFFFLDSMRLLPFSYPFIIGQITVVADATDIDGSGIDHVEFYIGDDLETTVSEPPYEWVWDRAATGFFSLSVKAYDNVGHVTTDEIDDLFIINLDIIGHGG